LCLTIYIITNALHEAYQHKPLTHSTATKQSKHSIYQTLHMHDISFYASNSLLHPIVSSLVNKHTTHPCSTQTCMQIPINLTPITTLVGHAYYVFGHRILAINRNRPSRFSTTTPNVSKAMPHSVIHILDKTTTSLAASSNPLDNGSLPANPTMMDTPVHMLVIEAPQPFTRGTGTIQSASNHCVGNRSPASDSNKVISPDLPLIFPMLDVPAPPMLNVPARQSPMLDAPAHLAYINCSNSPPLWTLGCITPGPSNPHDPGPQASGARVSRILHRIGRISSLLWTPDFITSGPSNPHDPGPSTTVAVHFSTLSLHLIFSVIAIYALNDFLCIPPRSPSSAPVFICSVCL
jgi:hypothetical protein